MDNLNDDIICYLSFKLNLNDLLNFSIINKNNYKILDNNFYINFAINQFSYEFWLKAYRRPKYHSKPLKNIKMELIRIENFQKNLDNLNINRWSKKDFYDYWNNDKYYIKNINYNINFLMDNVLNIL